MQARYQDWLLEQEKHDIAERRLETTRQNRERAGQRVAQLTEDKAKHLQDVTIRSLCFQKLPEIEATLVDAAMAGAHKGIAENQGMKRGVAPHFAFRSTDTPKK